MVCVDVGAGHVEAVSPVIRPVVRILQLCRAVHDASVMMTQMCGRWESLAGMLLLVQYEGEAIPSIFERYLVAGQPPLAVRALLAC